MSAQSKSPDDIDDSSAPLIEHLASLRTRLIWSALAFIAAVRLVHQARQADAQQPPDNFLPLAKLSRFERLQLRRAFKLIRPQQTVRAKPSPISR